MNNKTDLRLYAKNIRKNLLLDVISQRAVEKIRDYAIYKNSKNIMLYYPTKFEINLLELLKDDKNFYMPRVKGQNIEVCPYKLGDELKKSKFSIWEPTCACCAPNVLDLVIVPALMADCNKYRLGYGGGFYDRFICDDFKTLTVLPKELCVSKLPIDDFDKKIDEVIFI